MMNLLTLFLILSYSAFAADFVTRNLVDKTFVHDNAYCEMQKQKVEIEIRSLEKYTGPDDKVYGEHVLAIHGKKIHQIPTKTSNIGRYKLFRGESQHCTKTLSLPVKKDVVAIFLLKDQRPLPNTLTILYYDFSKLKANLVDTKYSVREGRIKNEKLEFVHLQPQRKDSIGTLLHQKAEYIFQMKTIHPWTQYDGAKFEVMPDLTYQSFEEKHLLPDRATFDKAFKWNDTKKEFEQYHYIMAINHSLKDQCIALRLEDLSNPELSRCLK